MWRPFVTWRWTAPALQVTPVALPSTDAVTDAGSTPEPASVAVTVTSPPRVGRSRNVGGVVSFSHQRIVNGPASDADVESSTRS